MPQFLVQRFLRATNKKVRRNANLAQLGDRLLRGLGLKFASGLNEGNVGDVHKNCVPAADLKREFSDGLQERQALNVPSGSANLGDDHIGAAFFTDELDAVLDLICHMWNHLHGLAQIIAAPLLL